MYLDIMTQKIKGQDKKICIFPMGATGKLMLSQLRSVGIEADFFCDNNPELWGTSYDGKPCISKKELIEQAENTVVIIESLYYREIKESLLKDGIRNIERVFIEKIAAEEYIRNHPDIQAKIDAVRELCADEKSKQVVDHITKAWFAESIEDDYFKIIQSDNQYFDEDIIHLSDEEVFVDLGAYIGDSAEHFLEKCNGKYKKMHLFELDPEIYRCLINNMPSLQNKGNGLIQAYPYGASNNNRIVYFEGGDSNSVIRAESDSTDLKCGKVVALDHILGDENVTFIKADIEGAEQPALRGAEKIIRQMHPTLAICIYHSVDDFLNIPVWIKKIVPEYKIYIRHYTDEMLETVCYAIPENRNKI